MVTLIQDYRLLNTGIPKCVTFGGKAFVVYLSSADRPSGCWVGAWCCQDKYPSNVILEMSLFSSAGVYHSRRTVMDRPILLHRRGITVGMGRMDNVAVLGYRLRP